MAYTLKDVSERTGRSVRTIRRYIKDGKIDAKLVDGRYGQEYLIDYIPPELLKVDIPLQSPDITLDIINRLQIENRDLAGQLGVAEERIRNLENQVKLLAAPRRSFWNRLFNRTQQSQKTVADRRVQD